jgi:hypothetical protein
MMPTRFVPAIFERVRTVVFALSVSGLRVARLVVMDILFLGEGRSQSSFNLA